MNIPTVLVPLDGSKFAESALPYAISAANTLNAAIELLCVSSRRNMLWQWRPNEVGGEKRGNGAEGGPSEYLRTTARRIEAASSLQVLHTVLFGSAADVIVRHSRAHPPELIVLSTHGRGPMSRVWLGSVADRVIRHASMPVLLVRPKEGVEVDLNHSVDFRNIMVALDGSSQAESSIYWAKKLGSETTAFTLVRVEPATGPAWTADPECAPFYVRDYSRISHPEAERYLSGVVRRAMNGKEHVAIMVMEGVPAAAGILRAADQKEADLIALTSRGRRRLPNLILGSVTDKVVRSANLPVLVVHSHSSEVALPAELEIALSENERQADTETIAAQASRAPPPKRRTSEQRFAPFTDTVREQRRSGT